MPVLQDFMQGKESYTIVYKVWKLFLHGLVQNGKSYQVLYGGRNHVQICIGCVRHWIV